MLPLISHFTPCQLLVAPGQTLPGGTALGGVSLGSASLSLWLSSAQVQTQEEENELHPEENLLSGNQQTPNQPQISASIRATKYGC